MSVFNIRILANSHLESHGTAIEYYFKNHVKLGCVVGMVVDSILPHAECGPNDYRTDTPPFRPGFEIVLKIQLVFRALFFVHLDFSIVHYSCRHCNVQNSAYAKPYYFALELTLV